MKNQHTKIGIGILIFKDGKVLLGKRKGSHGEAQYGTPGGHLEYMESIEESIQREIKEETGISISNIRFLCVSNITTYAPKHYIDIGLIADWESGEPQILEPNKIEGWEWYPPDQLPDPLFAGTTNYFEAYTSGKNLFDSK